MGCIKSILCYYEKAETAEEYFKGIYTRMKILKNHRRTEKINELMSNLPKLTRCSSFREEGCTHCQHFHFLQCCMKPCETMSGAMGYAEWKIDFEQKKAKKERKSKVGIPDALAGQFTPKGFPGFTDKRLIPTTKVHLRKKKRQSKVVKLLGKWKLIRPSYSNRLTYMEREMLDFESYYGVNLYS